MKLVREARRIVRDQGVLMTAQQINETAECVLQRALASVVIKQNSAAKSQEDGPQEMK